MSPDIRPVRKGFEAEERIRAKVIDHLRSRFPGCRIIHELKLDYGNVRLDVVAVTDSEIIVVEIKSEKDTLKRLGRQIKAAFDFGTQSWLVMNETMFPVLKACALIEPDGSVREAKNSYMKDLVSEAKPYLSKAGHLTREQDHAVSQSLKLIERADHAALDIDKAWSEKRGKWCYHGGPGDLLKALWVAEMRDICTRYDMKIRSNASIPDMRPGILAKLTGDQITGEVCRALRMRPFARSDPAITITPVKT